MKRLVIGIIVLLLAPIGPGCLTQHPVGETPTQALTSWDSTTPSPTPNPRVPRCVGFVCYPDPESRDYTIPMQRFGLEQINRENESRQEGRPLIDGELLVWQAPYSRLVRQPPERYESIPAIFGFDFAGKELFPIAMHEDRRFLKPLASGGRVVYYMEPAIDAPATVEGAHIELWDSRTRNASPVETGFSGRVLPSQFAGEWLIVDVDHNGTYGLWAKNLKDNRSVWLYEAPSNLPLKVYRKLFDVSAWGDVVVYTVHDSDENTGKFSSTIYEVKLESGAARTIFHQDGIQINSLDLGQYYLVWEQAAAFPNYEVYAFHRETEVVSRVSPPWQPGSWPSVGGHWATYDVFQGNPRGVVAVNLTSGHQEFLVNEDEEVGVQVSDTDGRIVVLKLYRLTGVVFETMGEDLYWRTLPDA